MKILRTIKKFRMSNYGSNKLPEKEKEKEQQQQKLNSIKLSKPLYVSKYRFLTFLNSTNFIVDNFVGITCVFLVVSIFNFFWFFRYLKNKINLINFK